MNTAPDLIPASLRVLWEEARAFCAYVLYRFDRDHLRAGIRRASGARISIWLSGAESALRRLILMAALALDPAPKKPSPNRAPSQRATKPRPRTFRVFRLHGSGVSRHALAPPMREPAPYGHIRFPADPILALARRQARRPKHRHNGGPVLPRPKQKHPLDRWVRLSRNDPDWRPPPEDEFTDWTDVDTEPQSDCADPQEYYGLFLDDGPRKPRQRRKPLRLDSTADWRRCYDEWEKLVPAPLLAARLDALERAVKNPVALIRRTARRLQSQRERTLALVRAARPITRLPRLARKVETSGFDQDIAIRMHGLLDSS